MKFGCDLVNSEINFIFLIKPSIWPKDQDKNLQKELSRRNRKLFSSVLKGLQLVKIVSDLTVRF